MLASSRAEAEPSTTMDASLYQLRSIDEDGHTQATSGSPQCSTEGFDAVDFGGQPKAPKRSPTYPFIPSGPSEEHIPQNLTSSSNLHQRNQKRGSIPKKTDPKKLNLPGPSQIRHSTTMDTNNSASFEDTAIWDQKALLSLGMSLPHTPIHTFGDVGLEGVTINFDCPLLLCFGQFFLVFCVNRVFRSSPRMCALRRPMCYVPVHLASNLGHHYHAPYFAAAQKYAACG